MAITYRLLVFNFLQRLFFKYKVKEIFCIIVNFCEFF
jgi:hypothetical protein